MRPSRGLTLPITSFGAATGRDSTLAIARAISAAASGDIILVPAGGVFLTRAFNISTDGVTLQIDGMLRCMTGDTVTGWPLLPPLPTYGRDRDSAKPKRHQALILVVRTCCQSTHRARAPLLTVQRSISRRSTARATWSSEAVAQSTGRARGGGRRAMHSHTLAGRT